MAMESAPTVIDGNDGEFIGVGIELRNPNNLILDDIPDIGYGAINPPGELAAAIQIGGLFQFAADGGDIVLNGHNLGLGEQAHLAGYNSDRMVVTGNSLSGHIIKHYIGNQPIPHWNRGTGLYTSNPTAGDSSNALCECARL